MRKTITGAEFRSMISWTSSNESVAAVTCGVVLGVDCGAAIITASFSDEASATYTVLVHNDRQMILPVSLYSIAEGAFSNSPAIEFVLPEGISQISKNAFSGCENLCLINLPDSVQDIGENVFADCPQLTLLCHENSKGHEYALLHQIPYVLLQNSGLTEALD